MEVGPGGSWGALPRMDAPPEGPNTGNFGVGGAPRIELVGG